MTILIVGNAPQAIEALSTRVKALIPDAEMMCFQDSLEALAEARRREIDIAFLETDMPELDGLDLGQYL